VGVAHEGVSRRPPISLSRIVARTHMYTYAASVWALSIVQGPFPIPNPNVTIRNCFHRCKAVVCMVARRTYAGVYSSRVSETPQDTPSCNPTDALPTVGVRSGARGRGAGRPAAHWLFR
jgi:hypothetical protein